MSYDWPDDPTERYDSWFKWQICEVCIVACDLTHGTYLIIVQCDQIHGSRCLCDRHRRNDYLMISCCFYYIDNSNRALARSFSSDSAAQTALQPSTALHLANTPTQHSEMDALTAAPDSVAFKPTRLPSPIPTTGCYHQKWAGLEWGKKGRICPFLMNQELALSCVGFIERHASTRNPYFLSVSVFALFPTYVFQCGTLTWL